jgi:DNA processing protein
MVKKPVRPHKGLLQKVFSILDMPGKLESGIFQEGHVREHRFFERFFFFLDRRCCIFSYFCVIASYLLFEREDLDVFKFSALTRIQGLSTADRAEIFLDGRIFDIFISGHWNHLQDKRLCKELAKLDLEKCEAEDEELMKNGVKLVPFPDPLYPEQLRQLADPPPCLYLRGSAAPLDKPILAIVGSRASTVYGLNVAETLAKDLALNGISIVSGLARGVDSAAHKGSLAAENAQIAVLGTGIEQCYPRENKDLLDKILQKGGAVITEFPPNTPPCKQNFPCRNRIIAGLAWGTLVVEATEYSGSLVTARFTLETNRELFAVPHNITTKSGIGPNILIQKGAKLVTRAEDIIDEMPPYLKEKLTRNLNVENGGDIPSSKLTKDELTVLHILKVDEETSLDTIIEASGISVGNILALLTGLKIKGLCREWPGARYTRTTSEGRING